MLCVVCGEKDDDVVKRPRVSRSVVCDLLKEWSSRGIFYEAYQRSCSSSDWSWHRSCHSRISSAEFQRIFRLREEPSPDFVPEPQDTTTDTQPSTSCSRLPRRSGSVPKDLCFFCRKGDVKKDTLRRVSTLDAVEKLKRAVQQSGNHEWLVQLPQDLDILAADIFYHKSCWNIHVLNPLRLGRQAEDDGNAVQVTEFIGALRDMLEDGVVMSMADIENEQDKYGLSYSRWRLKDLLRQQIFDVEFTKPKNPREPDMVHLPEARQIAMKKQRNPEAAKLGVLLNAAKIIREEVLNSDEWKYEGDLSNFTLPLLVQIFSSWVVGGPGKIANSRVHQSASIVGQVIVGHILSRKQSSNPAPLRDRGSRVTPLQIFTAVAVHEETRNKSLVNVLHASGVSISYGHLLRLEAALAHAVLQKGMTAGAFIPRRLRKGTLIHFAIDNVDFQEDTIDGKNTLHATITVAFQPGTEQREALGPLKLDNSKTGPLPTSLYDIASYHVERRRPTLSRHVVEELNLTRAAVYKSSDVLMLLAAGLAASEAIPRSLPVWSAFNSRLNKETTSPPNSIICPLPLLDAPAPEYSTLLTMMFEMEKIQRTLNGEGAPVMVAADMALYSKLLEMKLVLKKENWIIRIGDLHVVIAMLRCLGVYIEGSGLDQVLSESCVYGPATVRQILSGSHVNRGVEAHTILASALLALKWTGEGQQPDAEILLKIARDSNEKVFEDLLKTEGDRLEDLRTDRSSPMNHFYSTYLNMVLLLLNYIRAVRLGDWLLHLKTLQEFTPFFFAFNRSSYARFIPVYISMMLALKEQNPRVWEYLLEFWVIRKSKTPFTAIGCDHALEQVNRKLKTEGGLIGITRNPSAKTKFFLIQDELLRMKQDALRTPRSEVEKHHRDRCPTTAINHTMTEKVVNVLKTNSPFSRGSETLVTLLSNKVIPHEITSGILKAEDTGRAAMVKYQEERIQSSTHSPWDVLHRLPTKTFRDACKKARVTLGGKQVMMAGTDDFSRRLLLAVQRNANLDLRSIISTYELSLFPLSLFDEQGDPRATTKSALLKIFEPMNRETEEYPASKEVLVLDGMAQLQQFSVGDAKNFRELVLAFLDRISTMSAGFSVVHLIFDRYDVGASLKDYTRTLRTQGGCELEIKDVTRIPAGMSMSRILSTNSNKNSIIELIVDKASCSSWSIELICWWKDEVSVVKGSSSSRATCGHEEADTKIIYCLSRLPRNKDVMVISPDTDVLVLLLRHLPKLPPRTRLRLGKVVFNISTIREKLGQRADALTSFHALTGCDTVESFFRRGKKQAWSAFMKANDATIAALMALQKQEELTLATITTICNFISNIYGFNCPLGEARWLALQKKKVIPSHAPPTVDAAVQHILRAQLQTVIWEKAVDPQLVSLPITSFGFQQDCDPKLSTLPPAPQEIMETLMCRCKAGCGTNRCQCHRVGITCNEFCECSDFCLNAEAKAFRGEPSDEDDDE